MNNSRKRVALLGHPVAHSLSPALHNYWLREYKIDANYEAIDVNPEELRETMLSLTDNGYCGVNITVPHKEAALDIVDNVDAVARRIGAINTVKVGEDKSLYGTNTDAYGFIENLKSQTSDLEKYLHKVVILGAGGAARAVCVALIDGGAQEILLLNRTQEKAEKLKKYFGKPLAVGDFQSREELLSGATILVNTTSLGMEGMTDLELSLQYLPRYAMVSDIVYNPLQTSLLQAAKERGNVTVDGLGMLLYQAQAAFELWFGIKPQVTEDLRKHILREI